MLPVPPCTPRRGPGEHGLGAIVACAGHEHGLGAIVACVSPVGKSTGNRCDDAIAKGIPLYLWVRIGREIDRE